MLLTDQHVRNVVRAYQFRQLLVYGGPDNQRSTTVAATLRPGLTIIMLFEYGASTQVTRSHALARVPLAP